MGIVGDHRVAARRARRGYGERVRAGTDVVGEEVEEGLGLCRVEADRGTGAGLQRTRESLLEIGLVALAHEADQREPVDVDAGDVADGDDVLEREILAAHAEQRELGRQVADVLLVVVEAFDESFEIGARFGGHRGDDGGGGAAQVERADRLVEIRQHDRAGEFGEPAFGDPLGQRDLGKAQMRVDEAEREGEVVVGLRLDVRHLIAVPADGHGLVERQAGGREDREPLGRRYLARKQGGAGAGEQSEQQGGNAAHGLSLYLDND